MLTTKRTLTRGLLTVLFLSAVLALPTASPAAPSPKGQVVAQVTRPAYVAQPYRRHTWDGWNRRYGRFGTRAFQLDGTFVDQKYGCALVRDHQGQVIPLVGNPGDLRRGDHLLVSGRVESGTVCGTAFRVFSVERIWADTGHRTVLFDRRSDGDYSGGYRDRYADRYRRDPYDDRRDRYDDDRYDDDRYDRGDNRQLISLNGRLDDGGRCPAIRGDNGEYFDLVGDLRGFEDGDHARVIGFLGSRSRCGGPAIDVQEID